jgi:hypothetical protein
MFFVRSKWASTVGLPPVSCMLTVSDGHGCIVPSDQAEETFRWVTHQSLAWKLRPYLKNVSIQFVGFLLMKFLSKRKWDLQIFDEACVLIWHWCCRILKFWLRRALLSKFTEEASGPSQNKQVEEIQLMDVLFVLILHLHSSKSMWRHILQFIADVFGALLMQYHFFLYWWIGSIKQVHYFFFAFHKFTLRGVPLKGLVLMVNTLIVHSGHKIFQLLKLCLR